MHRAALPALLLLLLSAAPAAAQNMSFLGNSPIAYFTDEDMKLFHATGLSVLEASNSGKTQKWENPATGASGKIKVLKAFVAADGRTCKRLGIYNKARGVEGQSKLTLCKAADGHWRVDTDTQP